MTKKIGVLLSGCGVYDGAEIHEAVLTLLAIYENGCTAVVMAPDKEQMHVVNHLSGEPSSDKRNVLQEAARIARGDIKSVSNVDASSLDALLIPGGFGAAKNLCSFAVEGPECAVDESVKEMVLQVHEAKKPIGAMCIAPVLLAKIFEGKKKKLTIGNDAATAEAIEKLGHEHAECSVTDVVIDEVNKIVTTPAYMLAQNIAEANTGIQKLVKAIIEIK